MQGVREKRFIELDFFPFDETIENSPRPVDGGKKGNELRFQKGDGKEHPRGMSCDPKLQKKLDSTLGQRLGQHREIQRGQRGLAGKLIHTQVAFHSCGHADSLG